MFAFTIRQPHAQLIAEGCKDYEMRSYPLGHRYRGQRVAIHAAQALGTDHAARHLLDAIEEGRHRLHGLKSSNTALEKAERLLKRYLNDRQRFIRQAVLCTVTFGHPLAYKAIAEAVDADPDEINTGVWAWPITKKRRLPEPIAITGRTSFWTWTPQTLENNEMSLQNV